MDAMHLDDATNNITEVTSAPIEAYYASTEPQATVANNNYIEALSAPMAASASSEQEEISEGESEAEEMSTIDDNPDDGPEPAKKEIKAWMSPKRAREKELMLNASYRKSGILGRKLKAQQDLSEKLKGKNSKLTLCLKRERMLRRALEKIIHDILNVQ